jgi:hypothetical protein
MKSYSRFFFAFFFGCIAAYWYFSGANVSDSVSSSSATEQKIGRLVKKFQDKKAETSTKKIGSTPPNVITDLNSAVSYSFYRFAVSEDLVSFLALHQREGFAAIRNRFSKPYPKSDLNDLHHQDAIRFEMVSRLGILRGLTQINSQIAGLGDATVKIMKRVACAQNSTFPEQRIAIQYILRQGISLEKEERDCILNYSDKRAIASVHLEDEELLARAIQHAN